MSDARNTVNAIQKDHGDLTDSGSSGFRSTFASDLPYYYFTQRMNLNGGPLASSMFGFGEDDVGWCMEYSKGSEANIEIMRKRRARLSFLISGFRDILEDFDNADVECLRRIRTPLVTSATPLKVMDKYFNLN